VARGRNPVGRRPSVEDIRALAGPATPHFALQIRDRIRSLIEGLPPDDPARTEGERQIARLEDLARHSGEPRGPGPKPPEKRSEPAAETRGAG
jgi:hypothetical protein